MSHDLQIEAQMVLKRDKQTRKNRIGTSLNPMNGAEVGFALWFWPGVAVESTAGPEPTGSSCTFCPRAATVVSGFCRLQRILLEFVTDQSEQCRGTSCEATCGKLVGGNVCWKPLGRKARH